MAAMCTSETFSEHGRSFRERGAKKRVPAAYQLEMLPALRQRNLTPSVTGAFCRAQEPIRLAFFFQVGS